MYVITIDNEKCQGCGECVQICPSEVYQLEDGHAVAVNAAECGGCQSCVSVCQSEAIKVEDI